VAGAETRNTLVAKAQTLLTWPRNIPVDRRERERAAEVKTEREHAGRTGRQQENSP